MITWKVESKDLINAVQALEHMKSNMNKTMEMALYGIAEECMTASKKMVPVDTGALKSTGHVQQPVRNGDVVEITLGYGGVSAGTEVKKGKDGHFQKMTVVDYAWYVHENLDAKHEVGSAKYLETPVNERMSKMDKLLAEAIVDLASASLSGAGL